MDGENNSYIENFIKKLTSDKHRLCILIFGIFSAICSFIFMTEINMTTTVMLFTFFMLIAAILNIIYAVDIDNKIKYCNDLVIGGIALSLIGFILRVIQLGTLFSIQYFIAYLLFSLALILLGLKLAKNQGNANTVIVLLAVLAAYNIFEFFNAKLPFLNGFFWKIYHISEATLFVDYIAIMLMHKNTADKFKDKLQSYKNQIPSLKISIIILVFIAAISFLIGLISDLNSNTNKSAGTVTTTIEKKTSASTESAEKESTVNKAKGTVSAPSQSDTAQNQSTISSAQTPAPIQTITAGQTVSIDSYEFTLNRVELSHDVLPDNPPRFYNHYVAPAGQVYIYVNATIKNTSKTALDCDEIYSVTADYNNGYKYTGFNIANDYDGDFTYANITSVDPLQTLGVHCLIECPEEIENTENPLLITINLKDGTKYNYIIR